MYSLFIGFFNLNIFNPGFTSIGSGYSHSSPAFCKTLFMVSITSLGSTFALIKYSSAHQFIASSIFSLSTTFVKIIILLFKEV
ncbi:MAG: hypothetical protein LBQ24_03340 [Candidatus Peribacteria bacterium]|nr:hypothetical protein [Candidatus Peribacteria bacterium]